MISISIIIIIIIITSVAGARVGGGVAVFERIRMNLCVYKMFGAVDCMHSNMRVGVGGWVCYVMCTMSVHFRLKNLISMQHIDPNR